MNASGFFDHGIAAIGTYIPQTRISCAEHAQRLSISSDTLASRIGFDSLSVKSGGETTSDLACRAIDDLLAKHGVDPQQIGCLIVVTQNPDGYGIPQVSAIVHGRMGWPKTMAAFDISLGCSGYVYALNLLASFLNSMQANYGILVTADPYSKIVDPEDRDTALLFGDAATATLLTRDAPWKIGASDFGTAGDHAGSLLIDGHRRLRMIGREVARCCIKEVPDSILRALQKNDLALDEVDVVMLHQGSRFIVESIGNALGAADKTPFVAQDTGNTCCSSVPLGLVELLESNRPTRTIVLSTFGVGLSWGSTVLQLQTAPIDRLTNDPALRRAVEPV